MSVSYSESVNSGEPTPEVDLVNDLRAKLAHLPQPIAPVYAADPESSQIVLYEGKTKVSAAGVSVDGTGKILWSMRRSPTLFAIADFTVPLDAKPELQSGDSTIPAVIEFVERPKLFQVTTNMMAISMLPGSTNTCPEVINDGVSVAGDDPVSKAVFHLLNVRDFSGLPVGSWTGETFNGTAGRLLCEIDRRWRVTIDRVPNDRNVYADLDTYGGVAITHVGMIERIDGQQFTINQVDDPLAQLGFGLSFCSGQWSLPFLLTGLGDHGEHVSFIWRAPRTSNWSGKKTWYPRSNERGLSELMRGFSARWHDASWQYPLRIAVNWYLQALNPETLDTGIVLAHAALEGLCYTLSVIAPPPGIAARVAGEFQHAPADENLTAMLTTLGISADIPPHMTELVALGPISFAELKPNRQAVVTINGPHVLYFVRNGVIHGDRLSRLQTLSNGARLEAWQLSVRYLEMAILKLCGYSATWIDRVSTNQWSPEVSLT